MEKARQQWRWRIAIVLFVLIALVVRLSGMRTEFWVDEVWTWQFIQWEVHSWTDVFSKGHVDSNHYLNTLIMYLIGDTRQWWQYRIVSLIGGLAAIPMAMQIAARRGRSHALVMTLLMTLSYPMVIYSTEARGYGLLIFFVFLAIDSLDRFHAARKATHAAIFALAVGLGELSHATFVICFVACAVWSVCELARTGAVRSMVRTLIGLYALPVLLVLAYQWEFVRGMQIGGGRELTPIGIVVHTFAFSAGLSSGALDQPIDASLIAAAIVSVGLCLAAMVVVARRWRPMLGLFVTGIFFLPAVLLALVIARNQLVISPRFFLVSALLAMLAISLAAGELLQSSRFRSLCAGILAIVIGINLFHIVQFERIGRGQLITALQNMSARSDGQPFSIAAEQDLRTFMLVNFYRRYLANPDEVTFVPSSQLAQQTPTWYIRYDRNDVPPSEILAGRHYQLQQTYNYYGPSGSFWAVYKLQP